METLFHIYFSANIFLAGVTYGYIQKSPDKPQTKSEYINLAITIIIMVFFAIIIHTALLINERLNEK